MESGAIVTGLVTGKVKGGLTVMINGIRAFLPGSLVDIRPVKDTTPYEGKETGIQGHQARPQAQQRRRVAPRRARSKRQGEEREKLLETLQEGAVVKGIVKNITDYGAFVDLGGIDGLLHITDLAWRRVKHPSEVLSVGDEVTAKVLKFDQEKNRVSLGLKQLGDDPWVGLSRRYPPGTRLFGKVTNITDYGAFVEIEPGIEGLVHVSEMDWTNKNVHPDQGRAARRRSRSDDPRDRRGPPPHLARHEAVQAEPVGRVRHEPQEGRQGPRPDQVDHRLRRVRRPAGRHRRPGAPVRPVVGPAGEEAVRNYKKGEEVEAMVLAIDVERERISLGIKQLEGDPFTNFVAMHDKGSIVTGTVKSVDAEGRRDRSLAATSKAICAPPKCRATAWRTSART